MSSMTFSFTCILSVAEPKKFVYLLDNCPHDWLFLQCKAVVRLDYLILLFTRVDNLQNQQKIACLTSCFLAIFN